METKEQMVQQMQTLKKAFLGKGAPRYQRPQFKKRPLKEMLENLMQIPDNEWYSYAFSRDPINGKFEDSQRSRWMDEAIACGRLWAGEIRQKYPQAPPAKIAKKMGLKVEYPQYPELSDRVLFAEYRQPNQIRVYMDAVRKAQNLIEAQALHSLFAEHLNIADVLLCHEMFHFLEEKNKAVIYTKQKKIRLWSVGPVHNDSNILALGEIAAMSFARELTGISCFPYVLDVLLVYGYSEQEASGLYEEMMRFAGRSLCAGEESAE